MTGQGKLLYTAAWVTLLSAMAIILTLTYWSIWPYSGLVNVRVPIPVSSAVVEQGTLQTAEMSYCVEHNLPLPITVAREMELQTPDGQTFPLAPPVTYLVEDRCETRKLSFGVPTFIPPGPYHVHYTTSVLVNPIREIRQTFVTDRFEVVRPE